MKTNSALSAMIRNAEITLQPGSPLIGKMIREIPWPHECIIASLRRSRRVLIPHGDTALLAGDVLVAVVEDSARGGLLNICAPLGFEDA